MARHRTRAEQAKLVADWRGSRKSVADFCAERGLSSASLNRWKGPTTPPVEPELRFVRLERAKEAGKTAETGKSANAGKLAESAAGVVVEVGGALVRVERGFDPELLRGVFEVLSGKGAS